MSKTVLITGSTGFVANHLIERLILNTDYSIVLTYRNERGSFYNENRIIFEKADLLHPDVFDKIITKYKPDYVVHLAAMARVADGVNHPTESVYANLIATICLTEICIKHKVKAVVSASSNLAQDPVSVVGISKFLSEQFFINKESNDTKLISFRVPNVIDSNGAVTNVFRRLIANNKPITITHPDMSRMFISGDAAAEWIHYLMENGDQNGVYVSYGKPTKITDLAKNNLLEANKNLPITFIGIKAGEKLTEHCFSENDIVKTDIPFLGKLKTYNYDKSSVEKSINTIIDKVETDQKKKIYSFLHSAFNIH